MEITSVASFPTWADSTSTQPGAPGLSCALGLSGAAATAASKPPPTYYRLTVDGAEDDDADYLKCAELIHAVIEARLAYKAIDKGQSEVPVTLEEVNALSLAAPVARERTTSIDTSVVPSPDAAARRRRRLFSGDEDQLMPAATSDAILVTTTGTAGHTDMGSPAGDDPPLMQLEFDAGVYHVQGMRTNLVPWERYVADIQKLYQAIESGPCLSAARSRLTSLEHKFQLYSLMNAELESSMGVNSTGGGIYARATKVDNALHLKTSIPAPVLLEFLVKTARERPNTPLFHIHEGNAVLEAAGLPQYTSTKGSGTGTMGGASSSHRSHTAKRAGGNSSAIGVGIAGAQGLLRHGSSTMGVNAALDGSSAITAGRRVSQGLKGSLSLRQYLQAAGVNDPDLLTVEGLGLHPTLYRNKFLPYDLFNSQLNPSGVFGTKLLQAVLSTDSEGPNRGDLCGSLIRTEMEKREFKPRQAVATELMLDISGTSEYEVPSLAAWVRQQGFNSFSTNMWVLNIVPHFCKGFDVEGGAAAAASSQSAPLPSLSAPTTTSVLTPTCSTVGEQLRNIFHPLFMATLYPSDPRWSDVAQLLMNTGAVSIQTEATSRTQNLFTKPVHPDSIKIDLSTPKRRAATQPPVTAGTFTPSLAAQPTATGSLGAGGKGKEVSDFYFFYYAWANLASLNCLRSRLGLNTLNFNPSIQEQAPAYDQLACSFLLADNVLHATSLTKCWIMQFLYLYTRIGIVMSPLRDNALTVSFLDHPIVQYFQQGMQVSLSTSDPLHFHHRIDQPLLEEYSSLLKLRSLSSMDLCEMARNSVLNSNFPEPTRCKWLGDHYTLTSCTGNDVTRSCVTDARLQFRYECLAQEEAVLNRVLAKVAEAQTKSGGNTAKTVTIMAEASSPARLSRSAIAAAAAVTTTGGGQATSGVAALPPQRRLQLIANAASMHEGYSQRSAWRGKFGGARHRTGGGGTGGTVATAASTGNVSGAENYIDRQIAYPRIKIAYGNGLGGEDAMEAMDTASSSANAALYTTKGKRSGYTTVTALRQVLQLRKKYVTVHAADVNIEDVFDPANELDEDQWEFNSYYGVVLLSRVGKSATWPSSVPPLREFMRDLETVRQAASSATLRRLAAHRLRLLEKKFQLHLSMNITKEGGLRQEKEWNNRDFFTAHKVDTNIHMETGHNAHTLLEFVVDKAVNHGNDVVGESATQTPVTLRALLEHYNVRVETITVDELHHLLDTHADLHSTFLSPHNYMQGRYFAELTKKTLALYQEDAYSFAENRLTLQGSSLEEWRQLSHWFDRYGMASSQSHWIISIPREFAKLLAQGAVHNLGEFLDNIFLPLWEISLHPAKDTRLHYFLTHVSGFDCVEREESTVDPPLAAVSPHDWRDELNPPYNYYMYYLWANLTTLNEFRASRGLSTFSFRPQCGELGGMDHLIGGFLLANGINHGVTLAKHPVLEYVFYLAQIGIAMSPLSNTAGASEYLENPFPVYFQRGLNVSLATNTPLYFHFTREPLIEEYSIAAKLWQFEFNDLSEIARNSVLQCGFPPAWKARALGQLYQLRSTLGNDVRRSRVSDVRVALRYECYHNELNYLDEQLARPNSAAGNNANSSANTTAASTNNSNHHTNNGKMSASTTPPTSYTAPGASRVTQLMPRAMLSLQEEMQMFLTALREQQGSISLGNHSSNSHLSRLRGIPGARAAAAAVSRASKGSMATTAAFSQGNTSSVSHSTVAGGATTAAGPLMEGLHAMGDGVDGMAGNDFDVDGDDDSALDWPYDGDVDYFVASSSSSTFVSAGAGRGSCRTSTASSTLGGAGSAAATTATDSPLSTREDLRGRRQQLRELWRLEKELKQLSALSAELSSENSAVATMIEQMRERLDSEGLAILGGLQRATTASTERPS